MSKLLDDFMSRRRKQIADGARPGFLPALSEWENLADDEAVRQVITKAILDMREMEIDDRAIGRYLLVYGAIWCRKAATGS